MFGFGPSADDSELLADSSATDEVDDSGRGVSVSEPRPVEISDSHRAAIFSHVVEVFNGALPDFLANSVDPEAERRRLYDALDRGLKDYIESLSEAVKEYNEAAWQARQDTMSREMEDIRRRSDQVEQRAADLKQQQLSADRQKRALTERVHDLEQQRSSLEAEREQYELENRSLMSRLKVAGVHSEDFERLRAESDDLRRQLDEIHNDPDSAVARIRESFEKELEEVRRGNESLQEQTRVATEMLEDMRRRHREASDLVEQRDKEIALLREQQSVALTEVEAAVQKYEEYEASISAAEKNASELRSRLAERDEEVRSLKATIAENLRLQAEREDELKREIDQLLPPTVVSEMTVDFGVAAEESAPRISEDDLSAIEKSFETGEWFTATPPPETPSMLPQQDESSFGYNAPARKKTPPENPAQLSLF